MKITATFDLTDKTLTLDELAKVSATVSTYYAEQEKAQSWDAPLASEFGSGATTIYTSLLQHAKNKGEATLQDVANETGWSLATIRSHLMNAGRTAKAKGLREPVDSVWNPERRCVVYFSHRA